MTILCSWNKNKFQSFRSQVTSWSTFLLACLSIFPPLLPHISIPLGAKQCKNTSIANQWNSFPLLVLSGNFTCTFACVTTDACIATQSKVRPNWFLTRRLDSNEITRRGDDLAHFTCTVRLGHHEACLCPDNIHKPEIHHLLELIIAGVGHYSIIVKTSVKWPRDGGKIDFEVISVSLPSSHAQRCSAHPCAGTWCQKSSARLIKKAINFYSS